MGARGVVTADGRRAVVDPDGFLFGIEGDFVSYGGGTHETIQPARDPCEDLPSTVGYFAVQVPPSTDELYSTR